MLWSTLRTCSEFDSLLQHPDMEVDSHEYESDQDSQCRETQPPATAAWPRRDILRQAPKQMTTELTRAVSGPSAADVSRTLCPSWPSKAVQESRSHLAVSVGADGSGMPGSPREPDRSPDAAVAASHFEDVEQLPLDSTCRCTLARQMESLRDGSFLDRRENLLLFGKPGSGKSHCLCALGGTTGSSRTFGAIHHVQSAWFNNCWLPSVTCGWPRSSRSCSTFDALIIDDLGYVQQSREEMEVLFTLLAERYERGSVMLTSNLPFSKWEQIFKDAMTTAAAIDRLVHHSIILELNVPELSSRERRNAMTSPMQKAVNRERIGKSGNREF